MICQKEGIKNPRSFNVGAVWYAVTSHPQWHENFGLDHLKKETKWKVDFRTDYK